MKREGYDVSGTTPFSGREMAARLLKAAFVNIGQ
jgi:hypothetical protein